MSHPQEYDVTRLVSRRVSAPGKVPSLEIPAEAGDTGTYKNEIVVDSFCQEEGIAETPGIFLRVGSATQEELADKIIRIGKVIITDDELTAQVPTVAYRLADSSENLLETGELWYRRTDGAYFVHDGEGYARVNPVKATNDTEGITRYATGAEVIAADEEEAAVTPAGFGQWLDSFKPIRKRAVGNIIYVDQTIGNDLVTNDGKDPRFPFLTIERAVLEVARISYRAGLDNDAFRDITIMVSTGVYVVDNRPGINQLSSLYSHPADYVGLINSVPTATITAINPEEGVLTVNSLVGFDYLLRPNTQIENSTGAQAVIESVDPQTNTITVRSARGLWFPGDTIFSPDYSIYNAISGGIILSRGLSLMGNDVRKCIVKPLYTGDLALWEQQTQECGCSDEGRTNIFLMTGTGFLANITFRDNPTILQTHHLCVCVAFASENDLTSPDYAYYRKIEKSIGAISVPPIVGAEYEPNIYEYSIVTPAESANQLDADGFLAVNTVKGASPYISNCTVLSRFGMGGLDIDGSAVRGFRSFAVERYTNISLQDDPNAFFFEATAPGNRIYKPQWRHASYRATAGGYAQLVSCFTICSADHYKVESGGELSLANCFTNFGDIAFTAVGCTNEALAQDRGGVITRIVPPLPLTTEVRTYVIGEFNQANTTSAELHVNGVFTPLMIQPFSLQPGETFFVISATGAEYSFTTAGGEDPPVVAYSTTTSYFPIVSSNLDAVPLNDWPELNGRSVFIRRAPDRRNPRDRSYWLELTTGPNQRPPQANYVLKYNSEQLEGRELNNNMFIAEVRRTDWRGNPLPNNVFYIGVLSADGPNESLDNIIVAVDSNNPVANPQTSSTYQTTFKFLKGLGYSDSWINGLLQPSLEPINIVSPLGNVVTIPVDTFRPSTIRAFGTGLEWVGYGNYSSAIPRFQTKALTIQESISRIKKEVNGGRVYNVGMTQDGLFVIGDKATDLRTNQQFDLQSLAAGEIVEDDNQTFANVSITESLRMLEGSIVYFGVGGLSYTSETYFTNPISRSYEVYATTGQAGFVQFALPSDRISNDLAVTPLGLVNIGNEVINEVTDDILPDWTIDGGTF